MNLILLDDEEEEALVADGCYLLPCDDRRARHIVTVLKPEIGATVRVGLVGFGMGRLTIQELSDDGSVRLALPEGHLRLRELANLQERPRVEVLLAMPRPKVMMRLYSVLAQLGVHRIVLINACRVEKSYFSSHAVEPSKYLPELREGLEQAVDTRLPEVRVEKRFKPFIQDHLDEVFPKSELLRLLCHPGNSAKRITEAIRDAIQQGTTSAQGVLLAIGPEGGWVDFELAELREHGFQEVTLGTRILTTDVAITNLVALAAEALSLRQGDGRGERRDAREAREAAEEEESVVAVAVAVAVAANADAA